MSWRRLAGLPGWARYAVVGVLATLMFVLADAAWLKATVQIPIYVASAGLLLRAWWQRRKHHPDSLFSFAVVAFAVYFLASVAGVIVPLTASPTAVAPVPSVLDGMFLCSYLLLALLLWRLGSRSSALGRRDLLDTLIVLVGAAPLFWLLLIDPLLASGGFSTALVTYLAYPVCVFILLSMTVRLAFLAKRRSLPHVMLACWISLELVADVIFLFAALHGDYAYGQPWQAMWILSATCVGVLILHPDADVVFRRQSTRPVSGTGRLYLLAGCLATPILTIGYAEMVSQGDLAVMVPAIASLSLVALLSLRLKGLMVDNAAQLRAQVHLQQLSDDLEHQTLHDPLTGLGNRLLFAEYANHALAQRVTDPSRAAAVLLLDLDDFKTINDTFGHDAGDRVLVEVAGRLERVTRHGEHIFRLGGDEFAFVLSQARLADVLHLADRVCATLAEPYDLGPREIRPLGAMGISLAFGGQDRSTLLAEADMAMYDGKQRNSNAPCVFDPSVHRETLERHQLERDLREAGQRNEFRVLYQPLVRLATNDIEGVEALLRWEHPTRGTISPLEFIPLAEANGSILAIGDWVLAESLRQLAAWDAACPARALRLSVNVSPSQLADPEFVQRAAHLIEASGLEPARINLEVTEAAFVGDMNTMIGRLHQLKALGVTLAIDDFGTDYSSLSHLRRLPVDVLKIDRAFVSGIATEPAEWALTTAIIRLAASLGKTTVAEGIETGGQLAHLRSLNVELGQGYLFARPLVPAAIEAILTAAPGHAFLHN